MKLKHVDLSSQKTVIISIVSPPEITRKDLEKKSDAGLLANIMPQ